MNLNKIILLLFHAYNKKIKGKTLIQKRGYFLSDYLNMDFGYFAHYYGPYSNEVNSALDSNCGLGFLSEFYNEYLYSQKRFDYKLTKDGMELINYLEKRESYFVEKIIKFSETMLKAGDDDDYNKLSYAAKVHYIQNHLSESNSIDHLKNQATFYGWELKENEIKVGLNFINTYTRLKSA